LRRATGCVDSSSHGPVLLRAIVVIDRQGCSPQARPLGFQDLPFLLASVLTFSGGLIAGLSGSAPVAELRRADDPNPAR
jgi:hypothetical protein